MGKQIIAAEVMRKVEAQRILDEWDERQWKKKNIAALSAAWKEATRALKKK